MHEAQPDWWGDLDDMQRQMERFLDHFASCKRRPVMFSPGGWQPLVDVYETQDDVVIVAELAGVHREDVRIVLHNNVLTLAGERRDPRAGTSRTYKIMEVSFGHFERDVELPAAVDEDSAVAKFDVGFLVVTLRKAPEPKVHHVKVTISHESVVREL